MPTLCNIAKLVLDYKLKSFVVKWNVDTMEKALGSFIMDPKKHDVKVAGKIITVPDLTKFIEDIEDIGNLAKHKDDICKLI